jgi:probable HAF family extracellular repeat protein
MQRSRVLEALLAGFLGACVCAAQQVLYHTVRLPPLPGATFECNGPNAINAAGQVTGLACAPFESAEAYRWDPNGTIFGLGFRGGGGYFSEGFGISDRGHVAGRIPSPSSTEAFWWSPETGLLPLGDLPGGGLQSVAEGVNVHDQVVGRAAIEFNGRPATEAFLWHPDHGMIGLGHLPGGGGRSEAYDINNAGQVTGWSTSAAHPGLEAFIWDAKNGMRALGDLPGGGFASIGYSINDLGQICGTGGGRAVFWDPQAGLSRLPEPPVTYLAFAFALNDHGEVVGRINPTMLPGFDYAVLWDAEHNIQRIDDLLDAASFAAFAPIVQGKGINNAGWIIANTNAGGSVLIPFLLSDLNCDGLVDSADLSALRLYLAHQWAYEQVYPDCRADWAGDVNQDAAVDERDYWSLRGLLTRRPATRPPTAAAR